MTVIAASDNSAEVARQAHRGDAPISYKNIEARKTGVILRGES